MLYFSIEKTSKKIFSCKWTQFSSWANLISQFLKPDSYLNSNLIFVEIIQLKILDRIRNMIFSTWLISLFIINELLFYLKAKCTK